MLQLSSIAAASLKSGKIELPYEDGEADLQIRNSVQNGES